MPRHLTKTMRDLARAFRSKRVAADFSEALSRWIRVGWHSSGSETPAPESQPTSTEKPRARTQRAAGRFIDATYRNRCGTRQYKLFVPAEPFGDALPLVVMLHGCSQTPADFARVTGMNELAVHHRFAVVYPAQSVHANRSKCWNWFRPTDQQRGRGEPEIIAGLTRHLVKAYGLDHTRVYLAGLSAGGAMAVVLAHNYPELYAAIGVHSGLPYGAAHDLSSALAAMRGELQYVPVESARQPTPTLIFHGDEDKMVHPRNAQRLLDQFILREPLAASIDRRRIDARPDGRASTRTVLKALNGTPLCEHWLVHGGGHVWFGGDGRMPHADPNGPDASREMVRFFLQHQRVSDPIAAASRGSTVAAVPSRITKSAIERGNRRRP